MADYVTRQYLTGADIRELRTRLGFTQKDLSVFLRCSKRRIESWEILPERSPVLLFH